MVINNVDGLKTRKKMGTFGKKLFVIFRYRNVLTVADTSFGTLGMNLPRPSDDLYFKKKFKQISLI